MKRILAITVLFGAVLAGSAAFAHDPPVNEGERACKAYRPHGVVPTPHPVEARPDSNNNNFVGVCTTAGVVRAGTTPTGVFVAADGNGSADVWPDDEPAEAHWLKGYAMITAEQDGSVHGYCAGGGAYENGAQPDDEFMTGDCSVAASEPEPEPTPTDSPSPEPTP